ncbi:hypothetical protein OH77DRAFT_1427036 [Trametes cingulata]|nr:hypothetical protein OH77DRAFT_1427036 [Trametes cingulata]
MVRCSPLSSFPDLGIYWSEVQRTVCEVELFLLLAWCVARIVLASCTNPHPTLARSTSTATSAQLPEHFPAPRTMSPPSSSHYPVAKDVTYVLLTRHSWSRFHKMLVYRILCEPRYKTTTCCAEDERHPCFCTSHRRIYREPAASHRIQTHPALLRHGRTSRTTSRWQHSLSSGVSVLALNELVLGVLCWITSAEH